MSIEFICRRRVHGEETKVSWSITDDEIAALRDEFPGFDVERKLQSLADWTHRKPSKAKRERNMKAWLRDRIAEDYDKQIGKRRQTTSPNPWDVRGITRTQWEAEQNEIAKETFNRYSKKVPAGQGDLLDQAAGNQTVTMLQEIRAALDADAPSEEPKPRLVPPEFCTHPEFTGSWSRQCVRCGLFEDQIKEGERWARSLQSGR